MRYIHDGRLRDVTIDPPRFFIVDEHQGPARGRTDTASLLASTLARSRRSGGVQVIDHAEPDDPERTVEPTWRWSQ